MSESIIGVLPPKKGKVFLSVLTVLGFCVVVIKKVCIIIEIKAGRWPAVRM